MRRTHHQNLLTLISLAALACLISATAASAQTTNFTYQGRLTDAGLAANGNYDFQFVLFDASGGGTQIGSLTRPSVLVANGVFTVQLDFGVNAFPGADRFLEISVRLAGSGSFTTLVPRQQIGSAAYGIRSLNSSSADTAANATQLGGVAASQYVLTTDSRLTDPRPPTVGSSNYIQNTTGTQASSNFNISGNGTAGGNLSGNIVNATTQYNIGATRVMSINGVDNIFVGRVAGQSNTTGIDNSFFGSLAGAANTVGSFNSFFGLGAGESNTGDPNNPHLGGYNSFFGFAAGETNTMGGNNSFFGALAGASNKVGSENSFFGLYSGFANDSGSRNVFFGHLAGASNKGGSNNVILGYNAGLSNTSENSNTFIGNQANGAPGITNAESIGANASVTQSNSLVLGSINGVNSASADTKVGIGTPAPANPLDVNGVGTQSGGVGDFAEVAARFRQRTAGTHSAVSIDALTGQDAILYLSESGAAVWGIRNDSDQGAKFQIRFQGGGANAPLFTLQTTGEVGIGTTTPNAKLQVTSGDVYVQTQGKGIILRATDGANCYRVTVNNAGTMSTALVSCP
jgi:hypothetical protein